MSELLFKILDISNHPDDDVIILEDCCEYDERLSGYFIILRPDNFPSLHIFLKGEFPDYQDIINECFSDGSADKLKQVCLLAYQEPLTKVFIDRYKGIDNLIKFGPSRDIESCQEKIDSEESFLVSDEEDEEMIKELQEKVRQLEEENSKLKADNSYYESKYPEGEMGDDIVEIFFETVDEISDSEFKELMLNQVYDAADKNDEKEISRFISNFFDQLDKKQEASV